MKNIKNKVKDTFRWKKSADYCSKKLGISKSEFLRLKKEIQKEWINKKKILGKKYNGTNADISVDLEKGEARISGRSTNEAKSAEEIITILNIDTTKWKLSQYWNKQMGDHWRVSALISQIKNSEEKLFKNLLENWKPKKYKLPHSRHYSHSQICY